MASKGVLRTLDGDGYLAFFCPGCECAHMIAVAPAPNAWGFNGDFNKPTFTPSVLHNVGGANPTHPICHSFVTDGRIQFLADSTHKLAGQTVPLEPF